MIATDIFGAKNRATQRFCSSDNETTTVETLPAFVDADLVWHLSETQSDLMTAPSGASGSARLESGPLYASPATGDSNLHQTLTLLYAN